MKSLVGNDKNLVEDAVLDGKPMEIFIISSINRKLVAKQLCKILAIKFGASRVEVDTWLCHNGAVVLITILSRKVLSMSMSKDNDLHLKSLTQNLFQLVRRHF